MCINAYYIKTEDNIKIKIYVAQKHIYIYIYIYCSVCRCTGETLNNIHIIILNNF